MAVGDVTLFRNIKRTVCLATGLIATNGQPTDAAEATIVLAAGVVPAYAPNPVYAAADQGAFFSGENPAQSTLAISSTAGSGVMTGTFTLWGYLRETAKWYPIQVSGGAALAELALPGDTIRFTQDLQNIGRFDYLYLQCSAIGGTATAFEAYLVTSRLGW